MMENTLAVILGVMFVHWVGDFVFQTDKMATRKSKDIDALVSHVTVYYVTLVIGTGALFLYLYGQDMGLFGLVTLWWLVNGVAHFAVDFVTSRINAKLWERNDRHNFFVAIGFDQFLHYACLFGTMHWMIGIP